MAELRILSGRGHDTLPYTREQHEEAKAAFEAHKTQGFLAFRTSVENGKQEDVQIDKFDPEAATITLIPPLAGGC